MTISLNQSRPYFHLPLSTIDSFRVLDLEPSTSIQAPLRCNIREVSFTDSQSDWPKYHALSYVWKTSDQATSNLIYIKNASNSYGYLEISLNCASALRCLRFHNEKRTFWIDAICIDQTSPSEKNVQVPIMGQLYSAAERVIIWLDLSDIALIDWKRLLKHIDHIVWAISKGFLRRSPKQKLQSPKPVAYICERYFVGRSTQLESTWPYSQSFRINDVLSKFSLADLTI